MKKIINVTKTTLHFYEKGIMQILEALIVALMLHNGLIIFINKHSYTYEHFVFTRYMRKHLISVLFSCICIFTKFLETSAYNDTARVLQRLRPARPYTIAKMTLIKCSFQLWDFAPKPGN